MSRVRVVAVSYLNTRPFIYGIEQAAPTWLRAALLLAVPAACADSLIEGTADVALVPVAEIPRIEGAQIITNYCISAYGTVNTVAMFSDSSLSQIHTVYLDAHSRTSVQLVRIIAHELWHISPRWVDGIPAHITPGEAVVAIGDKVFGIENNYTNKWDLSEQWLELTGLPFVFAAWVARTPEGVAIAGELSAALEYGCTHIADAVYEMPNPDHAYRYLTQNIEFTLDQAKREAMKLFWEKIITPG